MSKSSNETDDSSVRSCTTSEEDCPAFDSVDQVEALPSSSSSRTTYFSSKGKGKGKSTRIDSRFQWPRNTHFGLIATYHPMRECIIWVDRTVYDIFVKKNAYFI